MTKALFLTLILFFLSCNLFAIGEEVNGKITNAYLSTSSYKIFIDVENDLNGKTKTFSFFKGEYKINSSEELIGKNVYLKFITGKSPLAIGVSVFNYSDISWPHFEGIDRNYFSMENYGFLGYFKGAFNINSELVFEIEGRNGRIANFPVPPNINTSPFYDDTFSNEEVLVRYVLEDELIITELNLKSDEETTKGKFSFNGIVKGAEDSGLGPHYGLSIENPKTKEQFYALVMMGSFGINDYSQLVGRSVEITYDISYENSLSELKLLSDTNINDYKTQNDIYIVKGTYESGEIGDMGGYINIKTNDGEMINLMTDFVAFDEWIGKEVLLKYTRDEINTVKSLIYLNK